jgi:hypothetical protein
VWTITGRPSDSANVAHAHFESLHFASIPPCRRDALSHGGGAGLDGEDGEEPATAPGAEVQDAPVPDDGVVSEGRAQEQAGLDPVLLHWAQELLQVVAQAVGFGEGAQGVAAELGEVDVDVYDPAHGDAWCHKTGAFMSIGSPMAAH